jgi:fatty acid desaturase
MIGTEIINLPHHLELPFLKENNRYSFAEQYKSARSCIYPKMISKHMVLNFNYHIEHHMFPQAAWYDLENIHFNLKENLAEKYNSDTAFFWIKGARKKQISAILQTKQNSNSIAKAS